MKPLFACIIVAVILLISCKSHPLIPGFDIGLSEQKMKSQSKEKLASGEFIKSDYMGDSTHFIHYLKLLDSAIYTRVGFNNDGVPNGSLRITVVDLGEPRKGYVVRESIEAVKAKRVASDHFENYSTVPDSTWIWITNCPQSKVTKVLSYLKKLYGSEDSSTVRKYKNPWDIADDTLSVYHHFHDDNSEIIVRTSSMLPASFYIPYPHFQRAIVYQVSKKYDTEFQAVKEELNRSIMPSDVISIPVQYKVDKRKDEFGDAQVYLDLTILISIDSRKSLIESRPIRSMRGKMIISDLYGEVLQVSSSWEIKTPALKSLKPGLPYALGDVSKGGWRYDEIAITLMVTHELCSQRFKDAVRNGIDLKVVFVPDVILFSDGSTLK